MRRIFCVVIASTIFMFSGFWSFNSNAQDKPVFQDKQESKVEDMASLYFPFHTGKAYLYELLGPTKTGKTRDRYVKCTKATRIDGESTGIFETVAYLGSMKIVKTDYFSVSEDLVYLTKTINFSGVLEYPVRPIILKVPKDNQEISWKSFDEFSEKEVTKKAVRQDSLKTKLKTFEDVIVVTYVAYIDDKKLTNKAFYAKGYGMVREELYDSGKLIPFMSREIVRIDDI